MQMFRYWFTSLVSKPTYHALRLLLVRQTSKQMVTPASKQAQDVSSITAVNEAQAYKEASAVGNTVLIQAYSGSSLSEMSEDSSPPSRSSSRSHSRSASLPRPHQDVDSSGSTQPPNMPPRSSPRLRARKADATKTEPVQQGLQLGPGGPAGDVDGVKPGGHGVQRNFSTREQLADHGPWARLVLRAVPVLAVFAFSGLIHELLLLCFFGAPTGEQLLFFMIHAVALLIEQAISQGSGPGSQQVQQQPSGQRQQAAGKTRGTVGVRKTDSPGAGQAAWGTAMWLARVLIWNAFLGVTLILFMRPWFRWGICHQRHSPGSA